MIVQTKHNQLMQIRRFTLDDTAALLTYLQLLSSETKQKFGPHPFDETSILHLYQQSTDYLGYIAIDEQTENIISYCIIKKGFLNHDQPRLESYGLTLSSITDCTFAPSVADAWQSSGAGTAMLNFITEDLKSSSIHRIILWGGVQAGNEKAVQYYLKNQFRILGEFEYNGKNYDMIAYL
jgi:diamine N-acetyltransferase